MATTIQEPGQVTPGELTPETEDNFEILCYQRAQDSAGLKRLGLVNWKSYLSFNSHKVDNLAKLTGFRPDEYGPDYDIDNPDYTLVQRAESIAAQAGVSWDPVTIDPGNSLSARIGNLETSVDGDSTAEPPVTGLLARATSLETRMTNLEDEVGSGGSTPGDNLFTRMGNAEDAIDNLNTIVSATGTGLEDRVDSIESILGEPASGSHLSSTTVSDVCEANYQQLNASGTGIAPRLNTAESNISENSGSITNINQTLNNVLTPLAATVGDSTSGLVSDVNSLRSDVDDLLEVAGSAYVVKGNLSSPPPISGTGWETFWEQLKSGDVYNINITPGTTMTIDIPVKSGQPAESITVQDGANIVWIAVEDSPTYAYGYFDELGTAINVDEVNRLSAVVGSDTDPKSGLCLDVDNLKTTVNDSTTGIAALNTKVDVLESRYTTTSPAGTSWTSANLSGRYIVTVDNSNTNITAIFYMYFVNGAILGSKTKNMDGSNADYNDYFNESLTTNILSGKGITSYVSTLKIGD